MLQRLAGRRAATVALLTMLLLLTGRSPHLPPIGE
jgi:hypothetical protein